jgi:glycosyltransferase involved in cell wall biosynthesis
MKLRIAINAQLFPDGSSGGVEQFVLGLVHALGRLADGPEEFIIIVHCKNLDWLQPYLGPNQRIVSRRRSVERAKQLLGPLRGPAGKAWRGARGLVFARPDSNLPPILESDGFFESLGADIIHFPFQHFVRCKLPTIFNPHDLQHVHFPQFFSKEAIGWRETLYRTGCRYAHAVATESQAVKDDLVRHYGLDPAKIYVIHRGAPTEAYPATTKQALQGVRQKFGLPESFVFYPARTWPHKNHIRLLEAIRLLSDCHGLSLNLVCTGAKSDFWPKIEKRIGELGLAPQVWFLGYVSPAELRAIYHLAKFLVFPSLFEGGGFPVVEAFQERVAVACSAIAPLEEYAGDAVLRFDCTSVQSIAGALLRMSRDAELRAVLRERGAARASKLNWETTGKTYRALYRRVASRPLSQEDRILLAGEDGAEIAFDA